MKNQFQTLQEWLPSVLFTIKKEIKTEEFPSRKLFYQTYFGNRPQNRISTEEIFLALEKELLQGNLDLGEWVINRWVFRHGDLYRYFEGRLSQINPNFQEISHLTPEQSKEILEGAGGLFSRIDLYLFSVLNGVAFSQEVLSSLKKGAEEERVLLEAKEKETQKGESLEALLDRHKKEALKLDEKYEAKLAGMLKKYQTDMDALKSQIRSLQKQLSSFKG